MDLRAMGPWLTTAELLTPLHPDQDALISLFQSEIDAAMRREIAEADYGNMADHCDALLGRILETGRVDSRDPHLREVLELSRWSEPDERGWSPGGEGTRGHWMRLFSCTVLVRLGPIARKMLGGETDTLAQLVASAIALGRPVAQASVGLLAWRFLTYPGEDGYPPFLAFAILLLAAHLEWGADCGLWLRRMDEWVEEEESCARNGNSGPEWLMGLGGSSANEPLWRSLAVRVLVSPERPHPPEADEALRLVGALVADP